MALIDFDGEAFRCRKASELSAGNDSMIGGGKVGWFVGKTMAQALRDNGWENAVVLGCGERDAPSSLGRGGSSGGGGKSGGGGAGGHQQHRLSASQLIELAKREKENRKASKGDGLVNDPHRVITKDDYIIFVRCVHLMNSRPQSLHVDGNYCSGVCFSMGREERMVKEVR
jgi:hypothetical protein